MNLGLILLTTIIGYLPDYTEKGYLNVKHLNSGIQLAQLQYDGINDIDLVIPKGVYTVPNSTTIYLKDHINLKCDSVTFVYTHETDDYTQNIFQFQDNTHSGIEGLTIDFSGAYKDKKATYANADKFVNRSIITIEHSDSIFIKNVTIKKILGSGIEISNSKWCQILNCNISGSWVYGNENGAQGYSISIHGVQSQHNLVSGCNLSDSRHQIVIQYAAAYNLIYGNEMRDAKALKKMWFIELFDKEFTYNLTLHGNLAHHNTISDNYADHRISIDNVKKQGNGPGNEILNNTVDGLIDVQSVSPHHTYNEGQTIKGNKCFRLKIEAKNCIDENNIKIK